jgi:hypothetical protein
VEHIAGYCGNRFWLVFATATPNIHDRNRKGKCERVRPGQNGEYRLEPGFEELPA